MSGTSASVKSFSSAAAAVAEAMKKQRLRRSSCRKEGKPRGRRLPCWGSDVDDRISGLYVVVVLIWGGSVSKW